MSGNLKMGPKSQRIFRKQSKVGEFLKNIELQTPGCRPNMPHFKQFFYSAKSFTMVQSFSNSSQIQNIGLERSGKNQGTFGSWRLDTPRVDIH